MPGGTGTALPPPGMLRGEGGEGGVGGGGHVAGSGGRLRGSRPGFQKDPVWGDVGVMPPVLPALPVPVTGSQPSISCLMLFFLPPHSRWLGLGPPSRPHSAPE